jgi:hypothetical protein
MNHSGRISSGLVLASLVVMLATTALSQESKSPDEKAWRQQARLALLVGNNRGAAGQRLLRYAHNDVARMKHALVTVGGFSEDHVVQLLGGTKQQLELMMAKVEKHIASEIANGEQVFLLLYFSGHSSDGMLELGGTLMPISQIRDWLVDSKATMKMGIVDSCDSADYLGTKGANPPVPADFEVPSGACKIPGTRVPFIASSSSGEKSSEGKAIDGSFFTFHWVSGMLGAADINRDWQVTLEEVATYAKEQTRRDTNSNKYPQTPCWNQKVDESGDLVLAKIPGNLPVIHMESGFSGRLYVECRDHGLVCGLDKQPGEERYIVSEAGKCRIFNDAGQEDPDGVHHLLVAEVELGRNRTISLDDFIWDAHKGSLPWVRGRVNSLLAEYHLTGNNLPGLGMLSLFGLLYRRRFESTSLMFSAAFGTGEGFDVRDRNPLIGLKYNLHVVSLEVSPFWQIDLAAVDLLVGGTAGARLMFQDARWMGNRVGTSILLGAVAGLSLDVAEPFSMLMLFEADADVYYLDRRWKAVFSPRGRISAGLSF